MKKRKFKKVIEYYEREIEDELLIFSNVVILLLFVLFFAGGALTGKVLVGIPFFLGFFYWFHINFEREVYWEEIK